MDKLEAKKFAFFLPNTFTALNMGCGFGAVILATKGEFYKACILLIVGAIFDSVDGRVARLTGTQSAFGEQFDSMSDLVSFGMAPALIAYHKYFYDMGRAGILFSFIFCLCGALRLARFNANIDKVDNRYFQGLPIPGAAVSVIGFVLLTLEFPFIMEYKWIPAGYVLVFGVLMITNIPFPSFKKSEWVKKNKKAFFIMIIVLLCLVYLYEQMMVAGIMGIYVLGSIVYYLFNRKKFNDVFDWKSENED